jgi:hypothetical protein
MAGRGQSAFSVPTAAADDDLRGRARSGAREAAAGTRRGATHDAKTILQLLGIMIGALRVAAAVVF